MNKSLALHLAQIPVALLILALVPGNWAKLAALLLLWALSFRRLSRPEIWLYLGVCLFFTAMNAAALRQGIFRFADPDVLGMPVWELFMWGFYVLHVKRVMAGAAPAPGREKLAWVLGLAMAAAFGSIADAQLLTLVSGALLILALACFHTRLDLAYCGYMVLLGAAFEYTGVLSGVWSYPDPPPGGVPFWFITMWGSVGLFAYRLVMPLVARHEGAGSAASAKLA